MAAMSNNPGNHVFAAVHTAASVCQPSLTATVTKYVLHQMHSTTQATAVCLQSHPFGIFDGNQNQQLLM